MRRGEVWRINLGRKGLYRLKDLICENEFRLDKEPARRCLIEFGKTVASNNGLPLPLGVEVSMP